MTQTRLPVLKSLCNVCSWYDFRQVSSPLCGSAASSENGDGASTRLIERLCILKELVMVKGWEQCLQKALRKGLLSFLWGLDIMHVKYLIHTEEVTINYYFLWRTQMYSTFLYSVNFDWLYYQLYVSYLRVCVCVMREKYIFPNNIRNLILWIEVHRKEWILTRSYI